MRLPHLTFEELIAIERLKKEGVFVIKAIFPPIEMETESSDEDIKTVLNYMHEVAEMLDEDPSMKEFKMEFNLATLNLTTSVYKWRWVLCTNESFSLPVEHAAMQRLSALTQVYAGEL